MIGSYSSSHDSEIEEILHRRAFIQGKLITDGPKKNYLAEMERIESELKGKGVETNPSGGSVLGIYGD
ncbi:MAG: hypothetical protein JSV39_01985 [Candidatus Aenigmatarchaeota archaeon]|nr:MAG: hypothetical protein JSV39_01985 [Candidatus Aenigmarchaeota archaeon]